MNAKDLPRLHPESLAARVVGFFALNPDEALALDDIVAKFVDADDFRNVHGQLKHAVSAGLLSWSPAQALYSKGAIDMPSVLAPDSEERARPARQEKKSVPAVPRAGLDPLGTYLAGRISMRDEVVALLRASVELEGSAVADRLAAKVLEVQA